MPPDGAPQISLNQEGPVKARFASLLDLFSIPITSDEKKQNIPISVQEMPAIISAMGDASIAALKMKAKTLPCISGAMVAWSVAPNEPLIIGRRSPNNELECRSVFKNAYRLFLGSPALAPLSSNDQTEFGRLPSAQ